MSYDDRIQAALQIIREHNAALGGEGALGYVNPDQFSTCLQATGGTSEARLADLSQEDILQCLPGIPGPGGPVKPRVLAQQLAKIFRSKKEEERRPASSRKAERMTLPELVAAFDPEDHGS